MIYVVLSSFAISINSHIVQQTKRFVKLHKQQNSFHAQNNALRNVTLPEKVYIFTGKVLKSFHEVSEYKENVLPILEYMPNTSYFAAVVKVKRVFRGNRSNFGPFRKVLLISSSKLTCDQQNKKNKDLIQDGCFVLIFAKQISFSVFKAEFTLLQTKENENDGKKRVENGLRIKASSRLRKGICTIWIIAFLVSLTFHIMVNYIIDICVFY